MLADAMVTDDLPLLTLVPAPSKRLVRATGTRLSVHRRATRLVVDDYGDAVATQHRCSSCKRWGRDHPYCCDCQVFFGRQRRTRDPEGERRKAREQYRRRMDSDPVARQQTQARLIANHAIRMAREPERQRQLNIARKARYRERMQRDPRRQKEYREMARVDNVLRRMDTGKATGTRRRIKGTGARWARQYVPSAPLALALGRSGQRPRDVAASGELSEKVLLNWRTGEQRMATWGAADKLLVALDRFWWEVFDPEDAAPRIPLCRWAVTDQARAAMRASAPRRCAGSSSAFSGVRSRDVVAWIAAAEAAALLWDGGEWPVHCTGCGWQGEREGTDPVDACDTSCPECRGGLAAGWPSTPAPLPLALAAAL